MMMQDDGYSGGRGGDREERGGNSRMQGARKKKRAKKKSNFRKKRPPLTLRFDYRDIDKLLPFLADDGKIVSARVSGLRAFQQRELTVAVKRARHLGYVSAVNRDFIY